MMAERVVRNVENDYLMCSICLGRYTNPRLLPCGHSFCKQCLEDHIKQTVTDQGAQHFKCPNDRTQIGRPAPGIPVKQWASAFPLDTFLGSLLSAVLVHGPDGTGAGSMVCKEHNNRLKEFFCRKCSITACSYCVIKNHKGNKCECLSTEEAVEQYRPRIDQLRNTLQRQVQFARQYQYGDESGNSSLKKCKQTTLSQITDLETKLKFYYQTAMQQIADMKNTVQEAGKSAVKDSTQALAVAGNINETINNFDEVCNTGTSIDIMNTVAQVEKQVKGFDSALRSMSMKTPAMDIYFTVNKVTEHVFENPPALGSVVVQSINQYDNVMKTSSASGARTHFNTPRLPLNSARTSRSSSLPSARSEIDTPRSQPPTPRREKIPFDVKSVDRENACWQLTGIAIVGDCVVVTDAYNGQIFKFDIRHSSLPPDHLTINCPVCVSPTHSVSDVVVTVPEQKQLVYIATDDHLEIQDSISTVKPYEGIAKLPSETYAVSCCVIGNQSIDIIDSNAVILRTIDKDQTGSALFGWPRFISATSGGDILVSDRDKRALLCVDVDGHVRWNYTLNASPWGVACHQSGEVYLCLDNSTIHVLSENGRLVDNKFVTVRDGVHIPYAISATGNYVAVTEWGTSLFTPNSSRAYLFDV